MYLVYLNLNGRIEFRECQSLEEAKVVADKFEKKGKQHYGNLEWKATIYLAFKV